MENGGWKIQSPFCVQRILLRLNIILGMGADVCSFNHAINVKHTRHILCQQEDASFLVKASIIWYKKLVSLHKSGVCFEGLN